jgi:single-strand DNA-binding protein
MKTIGMARLGRDAEIRYTPGGDAVCNLSLAVNYGQKGQDGNRPTQWIDASLWGKRAEALAQYLVKGSVHCFTLEDVHLETYQGKTGEGVKLVARVLDVELGPRVGGEQSASQPAQRQAAPAQRPQPKPANLDDDDIPF